MSSALETVVAQFEPGTPAVREYGVTEGPSLKRTFDERVRALSSAAEIVGALRASRIKGLAQ